MFSEIYAECLKEVEKKKSQKLVHGGGVDQYLIPEKKAKVA